MSNSKDQPPSFLPKMAIETNHNNNDGLLRNVIVLTCLAWLAAKLISWKLWLAYRLFPLVPPFTFLQLPAWAHLLLFVISLISLCWLVARPMHVRAWRVLLLAEIASCLFDQNRWQPWEFQFVSFFALAILAYKKPGVIAGGLAFILFSTYFFSGVAKVNSGFIKVVWQWLVLTRFLHLPAAIVHNHLVLLAGYAIPLIETGAAIFLLFDKTARQPPSYL